jgi:hypothetical protein
MLQGFEGSGGEGLEDRLNGGGEVEEQDNGEGLLVSTEVGYVL